MGGYVSSEDVPLVEFMSLVFIEDEPLEEFLYLVFTEDVPQLEFMYLLRMYLWWGLCTLYLLVYL